MGMPDTPENRAKFLGPFRSDVCRSRNDIANAALSRRACVQFITGVCLEVDGGRCV